MPPDRIDAFISLRGDGRLLVGRDRIALLEAVIEYGSMSRAAKEVGFSYKAAWDAVQAINNLLPRPAFVTRGGGRRGGAAEVTEEGRRLIAAFRRLEEKLGRISSAIAAEGFEGADELAFWGLAVKVSARNLFQCHVVKVEADAVDALATLTVSGRNDMRALVTRRAAEDLGLEPGRSAVALVKSSLVALMPPGETLDLSTRNRLAGVTLARVDGVARSEIELDLGDGKTLVAVIPKTAADDLGVRPGEKFDAVFRASDVILATD
ncbi:TOBE domain-containing protein [Methylocella sp.]|uniref:TOBE domain-containing protein n=1 Tax=Methylocella sp. TaxID=1978226 RepID=UPI003784D9DC